MSKIDMFTHVLPQKYLEALKAFLPPSYQFAYVSTLWDMDRRFQTLGQYEGMQQVATFSIPPLESVAPPKQAAELARRGNEELAEIVSRNKDRFAAGVACVTMSNIDAALKEIDHAIEDLGLKGILIYTNVNGKPLDAPEFLPVFQKMSEYDLPIWLHPLREDNFPDYPTEAKSKYRIHGCFGWPYETEAAMARLVCSGVLAKYSNLKFITHHCGGGVPFLEQRVASWFDPADPGLKIAEAGLTRPPIEYFRMFYGDTALNGSTPALMCGYAFFGAEHIVFGTDTPFGKERGNQFIRESIRAIEEMAIPEADKQMIFEGNARKLLKL